MAVSGPQLTAIQRQRTLKELQQLAAQQDVLPVDQVVNTLALNGRAEAEFAALADNEVITGNWRHTGTLELDNTLNHDGATVGFYGAAPTAQAAASGNLTDSTGGTANDTVVAPVAQSDKAWSFFSPTAFTGTSYYAGYYDFAASDNDFSAGPTWGTANISYAAHFFVVLGAVAVDELTLRVTGTSITDTGTRTAADTEDIVIADTTAVDTYFETALKWLGQVTITVVSGTAKTCNYGWCKYWDFNNTDFTVAGVEATWFGGANDSGATTDILLRHHKATGWTFNAAAAPTPPAALASMLTDHGTEHQVGLDEQGAWKRDNLNTSVTGSGSEGILFEVINNQNRTFEDGTLVAHIHSTPVEITDNFADLSQKINDILTALRNIGIIAT